MGEVRSFGDTAQGLARGPLGIIALFITLVYAIAAAFAAFGTSLTASERTPLIYFIIFFPVLVLLVFSWLVSRHVNKLYPPSDFKDEDNYVRLVGALVGAAVRAPTTGSTPIGEEVVVAAFDAARAAKRSIKQSNKTSILWVDDRPENNVSLRKAFEELGIEVVIALSTEQALTMLAERDFGVVISDMGRKEGPAEGYVLLDKIRARDAETPFFIYAGSKSAEHTSLALARGAQGSTNDPNEVFRSVTAALARR